jgi:hypothetical protein
MYAYTLVGLCFDSETGEVWMMWMDHPDLESDGRKERGKPIGKPLRFVEE